MGYKVTGESLVGAQSSQPTILCVEDNKAYLRLRRAVLEREGYLVVTASTGSEALSILRREPVCLVLSDHMLRGTTGVALAARMKKMKPIFRLCSIPDRCPKPWGAWIVSSARMKLSQGSFPSSAVSSTGIANKFGRRGRN